MQAALNNDIAHACGCALSHILDPGKIIDLGNG
jgi:hypothetical protein